jgi:release factor glutamine methyltransferase
VADVTFNGLSLVTAPRRVMTPRATSEQLVAAARRYVGDSAGRVVDVGTGSGAIAIAIATACPNAEVWATDTSAQAVALARANVRRHRLRGRLRVRRGDLVSPVPGRFDVIAANLPYVPACLAADRPELEAEPFDAVFGPGDGLGPYRRLLDGAAGRLTDRGVLLLQIDGRLVVAASDELPALRTALRMASSELSAVGAFESFAGRAA